MASVIMSVAPLICDSSASSSSSRSPPIASYIAKKSAAIAAISVPRESFASNPVTIASRIPSVVVRGGSLLADSAVPRNWVYTVGEFMTKREHLHAVKPTTTVDEALRILVENGVSGFPVVDDDWRLVGIVSDYDLLALDSISGCGKSETSLFPEVSSTWKTFHEIQNFTRKTNGKVVSELMTPAPLVVRETTNLEDAARLLLETKYGRLPVVDAAGKLVGMVTRRNVVRAGIKTKRASQNDH